MANMEEESDGFVPGACSFETGFVPHGVSYEVFKLATEDEADGDACARGIPLVSDGFPVFAMINQ